MTQPQESLQNNPVDPKVLEKQAQNAQKSQEQFIPQVQPDPETKEHLQERAEGQHPVLVQLDKFIARNAKYLHKLVVWSLIAQGLWVVWQSVQFMLIELPQKEALISQGLFTQEEANNLASRAIIMLVSAVITMLFAVRLSAVQSKTAKRVQTVIGVGLFLANTWIMNFLNEQNSASFVSEIITDLLQLFR